MKLKSDMLKVVKTWSSDFADLRQKHKLLVFVVMRANAGENKSQEIIDFFESVGVKNYFSTAHTRRIRNQFDNDGRKDNHGGIWTWRSILVQGSISGT